MGRFEYSVDGHGEFFAALRATVKPGADFLRGIGFDLPNAIGVRVFAMRANGAMRPKQRFNIFARGGIVVESLIDLVKRQTVGFLR